MGIKIRNVSRVKEVQGSLKALSRLSLEIGVFAGEAKTKPKDGEEGIDYAVIAGIHEFGITIKQNYTAKKTGKNVQREIDIPERSFIRSTFDEKQGQWLQFIQRRLPNLLNGSISANALVSKLGEKVVSDVQKKIKQLNDPPNAPTTIAQKGSSSPLIDTGGLRMRVTYRVVSK